MKFNTNILTNLDNTIAMLPSFKILNLAISKNK